MSAAIGPFELPRCVAAVGSEVPCLGRYKVLAGLDQVCPACERMLPHMRQVRGWARQMTSAYYLSDTIPAEVRGDLVKAIRAAVKAKVARKAEPVKPCATRRQLHELQRLVLSAQSSLSVDDYGEALVAAQRIIEEMIKGADPASEAADLASGRELMKAVKDALDEADAALADMFDVFLNINAQYQRGRAMRALERLRGLLHLGEVAA